MFNVKVAAPVCMKKPTISLLCFMMMATTMKNRKRIEKRRTNGSALSAVVRHFDKITIPMNTGSIVMSKSCIIVLTKGISTALSEPKKNCIVMRRKRGIVNGVIRLMTAVRLIESATSPRARCVKRFEVVPPGAKEMIIKPTASSGGSLKIIAIIKASKGKAKSWANMPTSAALGRFKIRLKSATCKVRPMPNIIINSDIGSSSVIRKSVWILRPLVLILVHYCIICI